MYIILGFGRKNNLLARHGGNWGTLQARTKIKAVKQANELTKESMRKYAQENKGCYEHDPETTDYKVFTLKEYVKHVIDNSEGSQIKDRLELIFDEDM